jgi:MYXO-CTERM domain-containing protein
MKLVKVCVSAFALGACTFAGQLAKGQNLLANPGFESGNFNGWFLSGSKAFEGVSPDFASLPESGNYSAFFGAVGAYNIISQDIPTTPGDTYNITFWLDNSGGPFADAYVGWGSATVLNIAPTAKFGWTEFGVDAVATGTSTVVSFGFDQDPSYFNLDNTSVVQVPSSGGYQNSGGYPISPEPNDPKASDQGAGLWMTAATLLGVCAAAGWRRRHGIA